MLDFRRGRQVLSVVAAALTLTACGVANTGPATPRGPTPSGWLSPEAKSGAPVIYAADYVARTVFIFPERGKMQAPIGMIISGIDGPHGLYVDRNRNLYVANEQFRTVTVYPAGSTFPSIIYSDGLSDPLYPIVDKYGNLFVSNGFGGGVVEYLSGSTTPYQVLKTPFGDAGGGMDFDRQGNLYVTNGSYSSYGSPAGNIEVFAPGSTQGHFLGMTLSQPEGLIVDKAGNILVVESGRARIDLFPPGHQTPTIEVPLPYNGTPAQLAIRQDENRLFVTAQSGAIYVTHYPLHAKATLSVKDDHAQGFIVGVALSNGQTF